MADNRGPELLIVNIVFFVVSAIIVLLRCYTRAFVAKAFGKDDWLMVIATVSATHASRWDGLSAARLPFGGVVSDRI